MEGPIGPGDDQRRPLVDTEPLGLPLGGGAKRAQPARDHIGEAGIDLRSMQQLLHSAPVTRQPTMEYPQNRFPRTLRGRVGGPRRAMPAVPGAAGNQRIQIRLSPGRARFIQKPDDIHGGHQTGARMVGTVGMHDDQRRSTLDTELGDIPPIRLIGFEQSAADVIPCPLSDGAVFQCIVGVVLSSGTCIPEVDQ